MATSPPASRYLAIEVPDDQILGIIAREAAINDLALDALEAQLEESDLDPGEAAAMALTVGRAGRAESRPVLEGLRSRLLDADQDDAALAVALAIRLLAGHPGSDLEQAEAGYRWTTEETVVFVEDPIAAHWHRSGRWGPPVRPDLTRAARLVRGPDQVDAAARAALDGQVVVVTFTPSRWGRPEPALRLTRAGFSRAANLEPMVRWSQVASLGLFEGRGPARVGFARRDAPAEGLPATSSIPVTDLHALMLRLLKEARS